MRSITTALFVGLTLATASADVLVDWNHSWQYFHPMGVLANPGNFETTWMKSNLTTAGYTGPSVWGTSSVGNSADTSSFDAGTASGGFGYGSVDFFGANSVTLNDGVTLVSALSTPLTQPAGTSRYTAYFRTTFTVPPGGLENVLLDYLMDDGGYVYIDGDLVLRVNMANDTDTYQALASNTTSTEAWIRRANLSAAVGATTGTQFLPAGAGAGNAVVRKSLASLAAGEHTLAIAAHNQAVGSSDVAMLVRLTAGVCQITPTATLVRLDDDGDPYAPDGDPISSVLLNVTVKNKPTTSTGFTIDGMGATIHPYGTNVTIPDISTISGSGAGATLAGGSTDPRITFTIRDSVDTSCTATISPSVPHIIGVNTLSGSEVGIFAASNPASRTIFADLADGLGTLTEPKINGESQVAPYDAASNGWRYMEGPNPLLVVEGTNASGTLTSEVIPLSGASLKKFSLTFSYFDTSGGSNYDGDDVVSANLIVTTPTGNKTIELLGPWDRNGNGVVNGAGGQGADASNLADETNRKDDDASFLYTGAGLYKSTIMAERVLPPGATSVQLVITGGTNSDSEHFRFQDIKLEPFAGQYDADSDGLPDDWETAYIGDTLSGAADDNDKDGNSNLAEYKGGTHPNEALAGVAVNSDTIDSTAGTGTVVFRTHPGTTYTVQTSANLTTWSTANGTVTGSGNPAGALTTVTATGTSLSVDLSGLSTGTRIYARLLPQ